MYNKAGVGGCLSHVHFLGWEPFIEPWPCFVFWQQQVAGRLHRPRLKTEIRAKQRLDLNVTSVLLGELIVVLVVINSKFLCNFRQFKFYFLVVMFI